ncbi:MAG: methionyl-tRNA formyltransferase [Candidatus Thiodiazotropha lotti]|uniref:methionyl-tRNA formyltransferase n=1 Tax=Candidatus Thiodiazotropha endoloripes TaxID=1818881 RepID=UPI00083D7653|nr:methionyl-tRNA formyltransferase [Candidatus Thiodiazotropha endoloripes]MCG7899279.1 methionyl-tRNA formyltransferase [Candidatus Thiodiazotropha weberae]MCG7991648.1 methionyl-tRNA formyltransferase [Candidatus Thiodiazotropha lotti]MCG7904633.1 methionyl-tRNA formyltransferase [Candidatus Thiodiazotropha weberae]MCG7914152.1 methionyl-tRNA formyltransferase [Candidatus Thiodiazotropha weberae]MCG7999672.1 methionyl-tRNA formyltransferase [Candidatus Thiodiazotropha lotti]
MAQPLKIIFAGTPDFAASALQALLSTEHRVVAVYTQPDRPAGRGRKVQFSPVKQLAVEHDLEVFQPKTLKDPEAQQILQRHQADLMVVVAYGLLLPQAVLDIPRLGCINIHASLLPRWRGAAPIQRAILAGDEMSGVTIMQMEAGLDTGPMLSIRSTPIDPAETGGSLHDRLAELGSEALIEVLPGLSEGRVKAIPQDDSQANYASKLDKEEARVDWSQSAVQIDRQVRAFNPWPVAHCLYGEKVMRVWNSEVVSGDGSATPGQVVATGKTGFDVATGEGVLRITQLQMPGKRAMAAGDFLNAHTMDGVVLT